MSFTCELRITCNLCGYQVCANPDHPTYTDAPHAAMWVHKETAHADRISVGSEVSREG